MKFLKLILANILRKKARMLLTTGSFAVALFLFGLLMAIHNGFYQSIEAAGADRLITRNKVSLINFLPYAHKAKIEAIEGVERAVPSVWFGGVYQDRRNTFPQVAIEPEHFRVSFPEYLMDDAQWKDFETDRQGCAVGQKLIDRFGWKIGDRIPIQGTIFPGSWEFNLRAIYEGNSDSVDENGFYFHYRYLEERIPYLKGQVGWYSVIVKDPEASSATCQAIDLLFENSTHETKTEPEKLFMVGFMKQLGNIKAILLAVGAVVIFTLLLVTGSTMAMAVRERTPEIAILKTLGFSDTLVLRVVLIEALLYAGIGGTIGLLLAKLLTLGGDPTQGMLPTFVLTPENLLAGLLLTALTGMLSGGIPAIQAMKLRIVQALRRV
jgi:putative ABC transport system permease protein